MEYRIRELELGGILDEAIALVKNHFGAFFGVVAVTMLPVGLVNAGVQVAILPRLPPNPTMDDLLAFQAAQIEALPVLLAVAGLALLVLPIANAAQIHIVANTYLGRPTSMGSAIGSAYSSFFPLYWTWFLVGAVTTGGLVCCVIPGIVAMFWFALATQVVVIEKVNGFEAMKRSREIMRGNIGAAFALGIIIGLISGAVQMAAQIIPQIHASAILGAVLNCVMTMFSSAAMVVFYFSCRCKNEQFDLQLLAQNVGIDDETPSDEDVLFTPEGP